MTLKSIIDAIAAHDLKISMELATHDTEIKALLATLQDGVDEANRQLNVAAAVQRQIMANQITLEKELRFPSPGKTA